MFASIELAANRFAQRRGRDDQLAAAWRRIGSGPLACSMRCPSASIARAISDARRIQHEMQCGGAADFRFAHAVQLIFSMFSHGRVHLSRPTTTKMSAFSLVARETFHIKLRILGSGSGKKIARSKNLVDQAPLIKVRRKMSVHRGSLNLPHAAAGRATPRRMRKDFEISTSRPPRRRASGGDGRGRRRCGLV
jgi:hypothetical protein